MTNMLKSKQFVLVIIAVILFISCNEAGKTDTVALKEKAKNEIANAEKDFEKMAAEKGIAEAFWFYADSTAVIKRQHDNEEMIKWIGEQKEIYEKKNGEKSGAVTEGFRKAMNILEQKRNRYRETLDYKLGICDKVLAPTVLRLNKETKHNN